MKPLKGGLSPYLEGEQMLHIVVWYQMTKLTEYNDYIISVWKLCMISKEYNIPVSELRVEALRM